jgi:hypothetical protein
MFACLGHASLNNEYHYNNQKSQFFPPHHISYDIQGRGVARWAARATDSLEETTPWLIAQSESSRPR